MIVPIPLATSPWLAPAMFALGCAMLTMILLRRSWRRLDAAGRLKRSDAPQLPPTPGQAAALLGAAGQRDRHEVELHDLVRDATAQIDTKLALLRELVARNDRQIARLEELLGESAKQAIRKKGERGEDGG